jgi:hypothetical protein
MYTKFQTFEELVNGEIFLLKTLCNKEVYVLPTKMKKYVLPTDLDFLNVNNQEVVSSFLRGGRYKIAWFTEW